MGEVLTHLDEGAQQPLWESLCQGSTKGQQQSEVSKSYEVSLVCGSRMLDAVFQGMQSRPFLNS